MKLWREILDLIERDGIAALVTVAKAEGSTPREAGARMIVKKDGAISGSIGGGPLEWNAIDAAKAMLTKGRAAEWKSVPLGPEIDQCCGGRAEILHEVFSKQDRAWIEKLATSDAEEIFTSATRVGEGPYIRSVVPDAPAEPVLHAVGVLREHFGETKTTLLLFGAGHVGRALIKALADLPFRVRWIDSRPDAFEGEEYRGIVSALPESELREAPENSFVLVMTHSHALDLALVTAALEDGRFPYVGLIGSSTKRALFERRLAEFGVAPEKIASLVCPIGVPGISGKSPAVIAAAATAELLQKHEQLKEKIIRTEIAVG
jgi:xanthine dehydrogenase accessory factor